MGFQVALLGVRHDISGVWFCRLMRDPITVRAADRIVPRPPNGTFTYEMHLNGKPVGTTRIVFGSAADGALTIDEQATITGIAAVSQTLLGPALQPKTYRAPARSIPKPSMPSPPGSQRTSSNIEIFKSMLNHRNAKTRLV